MDTKELEKLCEETLCELKSKNGYDSIRNFSLFKKDAGKFGFIRIRLMQQGLISYDMSTTNLSLTEKGWEFESFAKEREEKKLEKDFVQASLDTNISVKETNDLQKKLGWGTLIIAVLSTIAIMVSAYYSSKSVTSRDM